MTEAAASTCTVTLVTAPTSGAVAIVQLAGAGAAEVLGRAMGFLRPLRVGEVTLIDFAGIDRGLLVRVDRHVWQLMPHGGPRIVQRLLDTLEFAGAVRGSPADPRDLFPEADCGIEADMLAALAAAASPAAIDALAEQPARWRQWFATQADPPPRVTPDPRDHWLVPPTVVVVGRPNVGKSTLLNAWVGRAAALVADLPGTTRDWVGSSVELTAPGRDPLRDALAVRWLDTPGLRESDDAIEQAAIAGAREVVARADVLVALRSPEHDWPEDAALPRKPDLRVMNKADVLMGALPPGVLGVSARTRSGLDRLAEAVLASLGLDAVDAAVPWAFSETLRRFETLGVTQQRAYLGLAR